MFFFWVLGLNSTFFIIWELNQRATIQKLAHGMKSNRNSSFSRKDSLNMQFARSFGPKFIISSSSSSSSYFNLYLLLFSYFFHVFLLFVIFSIFLLFFLFFLCFAIALYFVTSDIRFIIFYSRRLLCFLFVFIIIHFLTPLIRCPLIRLPILT